MVWRSLLAALLMALLAVLPVSAQQGEQAPASITELAQRGVSLKVDTLSPSKGVFSNIADTLRPQEYAKVLNNLQMIKRGVWTSKGIGWTKERAGSFNSGAAFLDFATHTTAAGVSRFVFQVGNKCYSYDLTTHTETDITHATPPSATALPTMRSFSDDFLLYANGDAEPAKWTGDTATDFVNLLATDSGAGTAWPVTLDSINYSKPKYVEIFANRAIWAGFDAKPFSVLLSRQNKPEDYRVSSPIVATDAGVFDVPSQLGKITGLRVLRLSNDTNDEVLLIGCERGMAVITGSSALTFGLKELTREFGLLSNRTWVQLRNDLIFLATDGVRRYSQLVTNVNLLNSSVTFPLQDVATRIRASQAAQAFAVHHISTQEIQFWFPVDSDTTNTKAFILNYNSQNLDQGSPLDALQFVLSTKDGIAPSAGIEFQGTMYHGTYDGFLCLDYSGDTYNGTAINWEFVSPLVGANSMAQNASLRKYIIATEGSNQQFTANAYTLDTLGNNQTEWKARDSRAISQTAATITKIGTWATGTTTEYPKFIDFAPKGSGRYWCLQLKGTSSGDHIALVALMAILQVGGWKQ